MLEEIKKLIGEYYETDKGALIENYLEEFLFCNAEIKIRMSRRALKHIVEQRKRDKYSKEKIYSIFEVLVFILKTNNYTVTYKPLSNEHILTEKFTDDVKSIFIALEVTMLNLNTFSIKTGFYRLVTKLKTTYF